MKFEGQTFQFVFNMFKSLRICSQIWSPNISMWTLQFVKVKLANRKSELDKIPANLVFHIGAERSMNSQMEQQSRGSTCLNFPTICTDSWRSFSPFLKTRNGLYSKEMGWIGHRVNILFCFKQLCQKAQQTFTPWDPKVGSEQNFAK